MKLDLNGTWKLSKLENEKSQPVQTGEFKFVIAGSEGNQQIGLFKNRFLTKIIIQDCNPLFLMPLNISHRI